MAWTPVGNIGNPGFETADSSDPWIADGWAVEFSGHPMVIGTFDEEVIGGAESFESFWDSNEDWVDDLVVGVSSEKAKFDLELQLYEDFENGWDSNEDVATESDYAAGEWTHGDSADGFEKDWEARHVTEDAEHILSGYPLTSQSECEIAANALKDAVNLHFLDTDYHLVADTTNEITSADADDLTSLIALVTEEWNEIENHMNDSTPTWHRWATDGWDELPSWPTFPPTTLAHCETLLAFLLVYYGRHLWTRCADHQWTGISNLDLYLTDGEDFDGSLALGILAVFTPSAESFEGFEHDWDNNQDWIAALINGTNCEYAEFLQSNGTDKNDFDSFEVSLKFQGVSTTPGVASATIDANPDFRHYFEVTHSGTPLNGEYTLQARRERGGNWLDITSVTATPFDEEILEGYSEFRIYCNSYTAGDPSFYLGWQRLDLT